MKFFRRKSKKHQSEGNVHSDVVPKDKKEDLQPKLNTKPLVEQTIPKEDSYEDEREGGAGVELNTYDSEMEKRFNKLQTEDSCADAKQDSMSLSSAIEMRVGAEDEIEEEVQKEQNCLPNVCEEYCSNVAGVFI